MGDAVNDAIPVLSFDSSSIEFSALSEGADQIKLNIYSKVKGVRAYLDSLPRIHEYARSGLQVR
jgi:hypothetical protein